MADFNHPLEGRITTNKIRNDLGDFSKCIMIPSKYAARIAQAFSGTDPSVRIKRDQWEVVPDIGTEPHLHTDGQGTISPGLRDLIWDALLEAWPDKRKLILKPSAVGIHSLPHTSFLCSDVLSQYQIRFLGMQQAYLLPEALLT